LLLRSARKLGVQRVHAPVEVSVASATAVPRAPFLSSAFLVVSSIVLVAHLWIAGAVLPKRAPGRLRTLHYADSAVPMGVTPDGKRIDYRYRFLGGSVQSEGACEPGAPDKPSD
jgi:hypothetical protein